ncbi:hypothetical protein U1Q18_020891 [Sarracenia purpurea var. burkii]
MDYIYADIFRFGKKKRGLLAGQRANIPSTSSKYSSLQFDLIDLTRFRKWTGFPDEFRALLCSKFTDLEKKPQVLFRDWRFLTKRRAGSHRPNVFCFPSDLPQLRHHDSIRSFFPWRFVLASSETAP